MDKILFNNILELLEQDKAYNLANGNQQAALCYDYAIKMLLDYKDIYLKCYSPSVVICNI